MYICTQSHSTLAYKSDYIVTHTYNYSVAYIRASTNTWKHTSVCKCMQTQSHTYIHTYTHTYIHSFTHRHITYVNTQYICKHIHTHTNTNLHVFGGPHSHSACFAPARTQTTISWLSSLYFKRNTNSYVAILYSSGRYVETAVLYPLVKKEILGII